MSKIYAIHTENSSAVTVKIAVLDTDDIRAKAPELSKLSDQELAALLGKSDTLRESVYQVGEGDTIEGVLDDNEEHFEVEPSLSGYKKLIGELTGTYAKVDKLLSGFETRPFRPLDRDVIDELVALSNEEVAHA